MGEAKVYFRPEVAARIAHLELLARRVVEGHVTGRHRSPFKGRSVEFAQHREYSPGDDPRHLDWKVYAKSDRFYVKEYEEETNLRAYLLVDSSESMRYGSGGETKYDYAASAAAALIFLLLRQQDQVGITLFDSEPRGTLAPSAHPSHLQAALALLADAEPREKTDLSGLFHTLAEEWRRRGIVVILSDLFADPENVLSGIGRLVHARHEVIVFQILDEAERSFPFQGPTLFRGLEALGEVLVDPRSLREGYLQALGRHNARLARGCAEMGVDLVPVGPPDPLEGVLAAYLARRARTRVNLR